MKPLLTRIMAIAMAGYGSWATAQLPQQLTVENPLPEARPVTPVSWGVPFAVRDNVFTADNLRLRLDGQTLPAQFQVLSRWGGSPDDASRPIRWLLTDVQVDLPPGQAQNLTLEAGSNAAAAGLQVVSDTNAQLQIDTGAARFTISKAQFNLATQLLGEGGRLFQNGQIVLNGQVQAVPVSTEVEQVGQNRISVLVTGEMAQNLSFSLRLHFYRGLSEVAGDFRLENRQGAVMGEYGQPDAFDYGVGNSIAFDDLSLRFSGDASGNYRVAPGELPNAEGQYQAAVSLFQGSSGLANWNSLATEAPRQQASVQQRASQWQLDDANGSGVNQLSGWFAANGVTAAVRKLWQNYPKAFRAGSNSLDIGLFPGEFASDHQLRPGEYKTHSIWLHFANDNGDYSVRARSYLERPKFNIDAEVLARSNAAGAIGARQWNLANAAPVFNDYERGIDYQMRPSEDPNYFTQEPFRSLPDSIDYFNFYGWVDYGDIPLDFEAAGPDTASPYAYKYDGLRGTIYQALRTNNADYWQLAEAGAWHTADIDVHHTNVNDLDTPRGFWEGGVYGHQAHNERGNTNPHRNYMSPHLQTNYPIAGLWLWGMLSGDQFVLDSAREATQNTLWRIMYSDYIESGSVCAQQSGLQRCDPNQYNCSAYSDLQAGRGGANVYKSGLDAFLATGDAEYLDVLRQSSAYMQCAEQDDPAWLSPEPAATCDRLHMQMLYYRDVAHYLYHLELMGLPDDGNARELLSRRMDYIEQFMWRDGQMNMCYLPERVDEGVFPYDDNWLVTAADAVAMAARVLNRPELVDSIALPVFQQGTEGLLEGGGGAPGYYWTKEYVNHAGAGHMFMHVYRQLREQNWQVDPQRFASATVFDKTVAPDPEPPVDPDPGADPVEPEPDPEWQQVIPFDLAQDVPEALRNERLIVATQLANWKDTAISALNYSDPAEADANFGANAGMALYSEQGGDLRRVLIQFDLAGLALTDSDYEVLLQIPVLAGGAETALLAPVTMAWEEGNCIDQYQCPVVDGATWSTSDGSNAWQADGGDHNGMAFQGQVIDGQLTFNITELVGQWQQGLANNGVLLAGVPAWSELVLASSENDTAQPSILIRSYRTQELEIQQADAGKNTFDTSISGIEWTSEPETRGNFGAAQGIWLYNDGEHSVRRGLLQFDLAALPAGAQVVSARLDLEVLLGHSAAISVQPVSQAWAEGSCSSQYGCNNDGANWHEAAPGSNWQQVGGDFAAESASAGVVGNSVSLDVTADIQGWLADPASNDGWGLHNLDPWTEILFASSEHPDQNLRPKLSIVFIDSE